MRGSGLPFEEKPAQVTAAEAGTLCGWSTLVPFSLEEDLWLEVPSSYTESTVVAGAPQVLALAERLATSDNLDLTLWFGHGPAQELAARRPGPWSRDLGAAFHVALFLRGAQHSVRRNCPITYG